MYKKSDYKKELAAHGVKLAKPSEDKPVKVDTSRKAPSHNSDKPDQGPHKISTKR